MLPLLPILLIAKLSLAVPAGKGEMTREQLDEYLEAVTLHSDFNLPEALQNEVDFATGFLVAVHSALVLLQASVRPFDRPEGHPGTAMEVSSFTPDYVEKENDEVVGGKLKAAEGLISRVHIDPAFSHMPIILKRNYGLNLRVCFDEAKNIPGNFNIQNCLNACLNSVQHLDLRKNYLEAALQLIHHILLTADLKQVKKWLQSGPPNPIQDTSEWLDTQLGLSTIQAKLNMVAGDLDEPTKLSLSRIKTMADQNGIFFAETLQRLSYIGQGNDIREAVTAISGNLSTQQKKPWTNMQSALYGAVGWHIFRHAQLAAQRSTILLESLPA